MRAISLYRMNIMLVLLFGAFLVWFWLIGKGLLTPDNLREELHADNTNK